MNFVREKKNFLDFAERKREEIFRTETFLRVLGIGKSVLFLL